jgi:hypothetical protein
LVAHRGGALALASGLRAEKVENRVRGLGWWGIDTPPKLGRSDHLEHYSFPITQDGHDNARVAATVKTQRPQSQIGTAVAHSRKGDEGANRFIDFP